MPNYEYLVNLPPELRQALSNETSETETAHNVEVRPDVAESRYIYVRPTGSNETGDGSLANPYATVAYAVQTIPLLIKGIKYIIEMTGVDETLSSQLRLPPWISGDSFILNPVNQSEYGRYDLVDCPVTFRANPVDIDDFTVTGSAADPGSGLLTLTDSSKSYTVDEHKGKFLVGSGFFDFAPIISNTSDSLEVAKSSAFTAPLKIVECGASIGMSSGFEDIITYSGGTSLISFQGIRFFHGSPSISTTINLNLAPVAFYLCDIESGITLKDFGGNNDFRGIVVENYFRLLGSSAVTTSCFFDSCSFSMYGSTASSNFPITDCAYVGCDPVGHTGNAEPVLTFDVSNILIRDSVSHGFRYLPTGRSTIEDATIEGSTGNGVIIDGPASLHISNVIGTGNSGYGLFADDGAHLRIDSTTTVTGTSGDIKCGSKAVRTYADFRGSAPLKNEFDISGDAATGSRIWQP